jgi:hypothetical protein
MKISYKYVTANCPLLGTYGKSGLKIAWGKFL